MIKLIYEGKNINESSGEMTVSEFLKEVKAIYAKHFPDSKCNAKLIKQLGKAVFIDFYLAKDETEVPHGYAANDMFKCGFVIHLDDDIDSDSEMPESAVLESMSSFIAAAPSNRYLAFDAVKVPFRKTTGNAKKLLSALDKYVSKLAATTKQLYDEDRVAKEHKSVVEKKYDRIS